MKNQYRKKEAVASRGGILRQVLFVFVAFFAGYLTAFYVRSPQLQTRTASSTPLQSEVVPAPNFVYQRSQIPKPKLEFYTLLTTERGEAVVAAPVPQPVEHVAKPAAMVTPEKTAVIKPVAVSPVVAMKPVPVAKPVENLPHTAKSLPFMIQVAALRTREDAERMKASLLLKGFEVNIHAFPNQGGTWFRIVMGPFASRIEAEQMQGVLARRAHVNGILRKAGV